MKSNLFIRLFCSGCFIIAFLTSNHAFAQEDDRSYSTLEIGISIISNTNRNVFHDFWKPETGIEGFAKTPFHIFDLALGWRYLSYEARSGSNPDFDSSIFYLQLEKDLIPRSNIDVFTGVRVAMYKMDFEENALVKTPGLLSERELASGLQAGISVPLVRGLKLKLAATYLKVFTRKRLNLVFFESGISREFQTPGWLREFLK